MIKQHPTLPLLCDSETGMVYFPLEENVRADRRWKPRWTVGYSSKHTDGYCVVRIEGKNRKVHRLIADTFLEPIKGKTQVDHINRVRNDNRLANLRYVSPTENSHNSSTYDVENLKYGVHKSDPSYWTLYERERYKRRTAEYKEKRRIRNIEYRQKKIAEGFKYVKCPDGKHHWVKGE